MSVHHRQPLRRRQRSRCSSPSSSHNDTDRDVEDPVTRCAPKHNAFEVHQLPVAAALAPRRGSRTAGLDIRTAPASPPTTLPLPSKVADRRRLLLTTAPPKPRAAITFESFSQTFLGKPARCRSQSIEELMLMINAVVDDGQPGAPSPRARVRPRRRSCPARRPRLAGVYSSSERHGSRPRPPGGAAARWSRHWRRSRSRAPGGAATRFPSNSSMLTMRLAAQPRRPKVPDRGGDEVDYICAKPGSRREHRSHGDVERDDDAHGCRFFAPSTWSGQADIKASPAR